ncbi:MAG: hypothetical protein EOO69_02640 [Moraxellaceae bacterium]|nr:MAG: hypothetical protein EOO69_02640 [Moraxellaceae bacterium]
MRGKYFFTLILSSIASIAPAHAKKAKTWDTQTYSELTPLILNAWSYPEYQKFYGVKKVSEPLQSCYLSKSAAENGFRSNLELLPFLYSEYSQDEIHQFILLLKNGITDYYHRYSLMNFLESRSDSLDEISKKEISSILIDMPKVDTDQVANTLARNDIRPYRVLFSLGTQEIVMAKTKYALLDSSVIDYCKSNIGAGQNA